MPNDGGWVHAPVGVADVADALGENSLDVGTLCMSSQINPMSLIRPVYVTTKPGLEVKEMKLGMPDEWPDGVSLPQSDWQKMNWGYWVPKIAFNLANLLANRNRVWYKATPTATSYKSLNHFDGYQHNASYSFVFRCNFSTANPISMIASFGQERDRVTPTGNDNPGGSVNVSEVFGGELGKSMYFVCAIWRKGSLENDDKYINQGYVASAKTISQLSGSCLMTATTNSSHTLYGAGSATSIIPSPNYTYLVVPFIVNNKSFNTSTNIYLLNADEDNIVSFVYEMPTANISIRPSSTIVSIDQYGINLRLDIRNTFSTNMVISDLYVNAKFRLQTGLSAKVYNDQFLPDQRSYTIPPGDSSISVKVSQNTTSRPNGISAAEMGDAYYHEKSLLSYISVTGEYNPNDGTGKQDIDSGNLIAISATT